MSVGKQSDILGIYIGEVRDLEAEGIDRPIVSHTVKGEIIAAKVSSVFDVLSVSLKLLVEFLVSAVL